MATITSASSLADIQNAYLDNYGYEEDESVSKARAFITVCRAMLGLGIKRIPDGDQVMQFSPASLRAMMNDARRYVAAKDRGRNTGPRVTQISFRNFRS